jgi:hypothetical protein
LARIEARDYRWRQFAPLVSGGLLFDPPEMAASALSGGTETDLPDSLARMAVRELRLLGELKVPIVRYLPNVTHIVGR